MDGSSLLTHGRPPWMRGITGRTLTVALLMTELTCRRLTRKGAQGSALNRSFAGQRPAARVDVAGPTPSLTCGFSSVGRRFTPVKWRPLRGLICRRLGRNRQGEKPGILWLMRG
jgi:hypothetical protein